MVIEPVRVEPESRRPDGRFRGFGPFWEGFGPRDRSQGEKMAAACPRVDSHDLATILDPFRAMFVDLGPDRLSATWTVETSETSTLCVETGQMSVLATEDICTADI